MPGAGIEKDLDSGIYRSSAGRSRAKACATQSTELSSGAAQRSSSDVTALGAKAAQVGGQIASDVVDRDHTLDHIADIAAVEDVLAPSQSPANVKNVNGCDYDRCATGCKLRNSTSIKRYQISKT